MRSNKELQDLVEELEDHVAKPEDGGVRPGHLPEHDLDPRRKFQHQTILKKGHVSVGVRKEQLAWQRCIVFIGAVPSYYDLTPFRSNA